LLYITFAFREMLFIIRHWNRDVCWVKLML
jgi:hypothetical protein